MYKKGLYMRLKNLKEFMLLPQKEILLNKMIQIRGIDAQLISITCEKHRNVLWIIYKWPISNENLIEKTHRSNREKMAYDTNIEANNRHIFISEMSIQNHKISFNSSSIRAMNTLDYDGCMLLQHFIEKGVDVTLWDDVHLNNISIGSYELSNSHFPELDLSKEFDIELKVAMELKQILINKPISLQIGDMDKGNRFTFYDTVHKKNRVFYINRIYHYDIWEYFESKDMDESHKKRCLPSLEDICPRGMDIALIEYETEDDIQLDFYSKEYLDEKPVYRGSSCGLILGLNSNNSIGLNGFKSRVCIIKPIEKNFNGIMDIELFSWYLKIPEEVIKARN